MNKDSFYFLHIIKTAGRFFTQNIVVPLDKILKENNIKNFYDRDSYVAHQHWANFITDKTYVTSLFRDPVAHTVSTYSHYSMLGDDTRRLVPVGDLNYDKYKMFDWMEKNKNIYANIQSKNFLVSNSNMDKSSYVTSSSIKNCILSKEIIFNRLNEVSLLIRSEDLKEKNIKKVLNKIMSDLNIPIQTINHPMQKASNYWNPDSTRIYKSLNEKEKEIILNWAKFDAEVFNTNSLFYKMEG